jgi:hypothetical protein
MKLAMQLKLRRYLLLGLILFWIALFILTHLPPHQAAGLRKVITEPKFVAADKLFHFCAYFGLTSWFCAWSWVGRKPRWLEVVLIFAGILVYGAAEELSQGPFGRTPDINDWIANVLGSITGMTVMLLLWTFGPKWLSRTPNDINQRRDNVASIPMPMGYGN